MQRKEIVADTVGMQQSPPAMRLGRSNAGRAPANGHAKSL
jgi:hypothetical protein